MCRYDGVTFSAEFPGGRLNGCRRVGGNAFELSIRPEDEPINPSPWYAFAVTSDRPRALSLTLDYGDARHRYEPKRSTTGDRWQTLGETVVLSDEGGRATLHLDVPEGRTLLAAQPIIAPRDTLTWATRIADTGHFALTHLGRSAQGRDIPALRSNSAGSEAVIVTGRQHPPEITGARALRSFVERLAGDDPLAQRFRRRFTILVVPLLNPDGVALGHWRHDTAGTDLNRDWGPFRRPETRRLRAALQDLADSGTPPALLIDFHSTYRDVLYTQPDHAPGSRADFPAAWHTAINARLPGTGIERSASHNAGKPTLKTWAHETYGIPAVTFEIGDDTPASRIDMAACIAAEEMMALLTEPGEPGGP